ncbi:hypothetical protein [Streptomyces acidiscabies]|uniref:Uncharacterized protein n=1 Tax=Streptomyces acidiscabies TaxID=42234 RepID=A0ABU4M982_9ACTN|nr:hypothetical protein [Streptomyces acidiscabies]MDX3024039.1 hypothetical protein [Streptomyces acidiscabies]
MNTSSPFGASPPLTPNTPASSVRAATGVIAAAMASGSATAREIAQAEADAGILFDPQRAEDIASAAAEQAHAEAHAAIAERGRQLAALAGVRRQLDAVMRLCEGRPATHLVSVAEVVLAAERALTPYGSVPMTLAWTGQVDVAAGEAVVRCTSSYGGRADVVVRGDARTALADQVGATVRDIHAPCSTDGCGTPDDYDASDPAMLGWARLEVAGIEDAGARWYCTPECVADALARASVELEADDRAAAVDPAQQALAPSGVCGPAAGGLVDGGRQ